MDTLRLHWRAVAAALVVCAGMAAVRAEPPLPTFFREQRRINFRTEGAFPKYQLPNISPPGTVSRKAEALEPIYLSLDETIRRTLQNADVIRILAGTSATASARTIYDPAISNTLIDQQNARFDPTFNADNIWSRDETGAAVFDPPVPNPLTSRIGSLQTDGYRLDSSISKQNSLGGTARFGANTNPQRFAPGVFPLDPQNRSSLELSYTQPLLQGAGTAATLSPIFVARINTERSYYQLKDTVQEQVRSAIDGYWALVFARVDVWVRQQQVEQTQEALRVAEGRFDADLADIAEVTQARTSLANFRATLIGAEANLIQREAALRNLMGLPPSDGIQFVPVTPPRFDAYEADWDAMCELASFSRPDLVDLQLTLEADERLLAQARNSSLPRADAQLLYRWDGLTGLQPDRNRQTASLGRFEDWTVGMNVSVPLGQRQARAVQRQQELIVMRDRANLRQGGHNAVHQLATSLRAVDQSFAQYQAFAEARRASRINLERQIALYRNGRSIYLNVLQAIFDWGNTISSEANALTQFNTQLANLERQTGTILETHGVFFFEEQYASTGPLGRLFPGARYPAALHPDYSAERYPVSEKSAEESFDLEEPARPDVDSVLPELPYRDFLPQNRPPAGDAPSLVPPEAGDPSARRRRASPGAKPDMLIPVRYEAPRRLQ